MADTPLPSSPDSSSTLSPTNDTFSPLASPSPSEAEAIGEEIMSPASSTFSLPEPLPSERYQPPGRLSDKHLKFFQEPRAHPKLVEVFRAFGMDGSQPNPFSKLKPEDLASKGQMAQNHVDTQTMYEMLPNDLPEDEEEGEVDMEEVRFESFDGMERKLFVFRPKGVEGPLPAVVYTASAVTILDTANKVHFRWCTSLALQNLLVIAVDFRSAWEKGRHNPFPIGLNDCCYAVQYIHTHRESLGISDKIVLQGESGGANLALATSLKAKKEGWVEQIKGVYGISPWISNGYGWSDERKLEELPSLFECEGYWLYTAMLAGMGTWYSGGGSEEERERNAEHPLAWPYHASVEECVGLPPHCLTMDELCPLRDEGMAYYRKLLAAGVQVNASVNLGVVHGSGLIFRRILPEVHKKAIHEIAAFVKSV